MQRTTMRALRAAAVALVLAEAVLGAPGAATATGIAGPACDFNGDGRSDLALGVPGESVGTLDSAGAVNVLYGSAAGVTATGNQLFHQDSAGVDGVAEAGDAFGSDTACGDFNGDGRDDLAVGVSHESVDVSANSVYDAGAVNILYGSASGLTTTGNQVLHQATPGVPETPERADEFGTALAAGDFNGDGRDDLAVGAPGENVDGANQTGTVTVFHGTRTGLSGTGSQDWNQATSGVEGDPEGGEQLGAALAAGDFNGDGEADLAMGTPGESIGGEAWVGSVNVLYGSAAGLSAVGDQVWNQSTTGVPGNWEAGDLTGTAVTAGDFDGDGRDDLAIGSPGEDDGAIRDAGAVNVIYGAASGLTASGSQIVTRNTLLLSGLAQAGDSFGSALAAGDFNGSGHDELAIGIPRATVAGNVAAGAVAVAFGSPAGLSLLTSQAVSQGTLGVEGLLEAGDSLGYALGTGDFDGNGRGDLAAAAPGEADGTQPGAGAVNVLYGSVLRLLTANDQIFSQNTAGIEGVASAYDRFGGGPGVSTGQYRVGYTTGTRVTVTRDHQSHSPSRFRIDMVGVNAGPDYQIVAARTGTIRYIVDGNVEPTDNNNYVWIEHADGEWSKYTHFQTNSVTSRGHQVGDVVTAGTVLGLEGDIGQASGEHLHFEVAVPDSTANPINSGGFIRGLDRIPQICGVPGNVFLQGQTYTAAPC